MTELNNILVVGDAGVGKTQYINKKLKSAFNPKYEPTCGGINARGNDSVTYYEWPGQDKYVDDKYTDTLPKIDQVIYLYDCTSRLSRSNVKGWEKKVGIHLGNSIPSVLIGNKSDKINETKVITRKMFSSK